MSEHINPKTTHFLNSKNYNIYKPAIMSHEKISQSSTQPNITTSSGCVVGGVYGA